ncbi:MAG TPA: amidohydrolase family protein [Rhodanobacteraceae bacterium]|nr:amidohydrolase family protein [Rhodanobacteraceae bacterium]
MHANALFLAVALTSCAHAASSVRNDTMLMQGNHAGWQTVETLDNGAVRAEFSYNDRSHGDHIAATWSLDAAGVPTEYTGQGVDYMKAPVDERFSLHGGKGTWKTLGGIGESNVKGSAFYMPANAPPEFYGVLARALLKAPDHRLALLPSGSASIAAAGDVILDAGKSQWTHYRISGLDFMPVSVWLDRERATAAFASLWLSTIVASHEADVPLLLDRQDATNETWFGRLASELTHAPAHDLVIRDARLFDPRDLSVTPGTSVLVRGDRIVRVAPDEKMQSGAGAQILDAQGQFLMPGMWDNHQHFDGADGMLDIANGVTSARDMANDTHVFLKRVARFDAGTEIGPRVLKAGILDGTGPNSGPFETRALVDTAEQAIEQVDWYANHGYVQIKTYMSLKPELVPVIADHAHARGLRLSGHVPAFMSARQFIEAGADEIQHFNYVELNFLYPQVRETTLMSERFIKVAAHAREFTSDKPEVREFIEFLKRHHTSLDPTIGLLEARFTGSAAQVTPGLENIVARFPPQVRRTLTGGAYEAPKGFEDAYRDAIPSMLRLLKAIYDAGVPILPGTDALSGYLLHHELELYVRAGIAPAEVLRMATLTPAQVMGVDRDLGVIAPGKYADLVLVDGDPTRNISDIRRIRTVVKAGKMFDSRAIEQALGIAPR